MKEWINGLKYRVIEGCDITFDEAKQLIDIEQPEDINALLNAAHEITLHFHSREAGICSLVNAKSYLCGEDCAFCAQSVHFYTRSDRYPLMSPDPVVAIAKEFEKKGIRDFCVVTSGGALNDREFDGILEIYRRLGSETTLNLDGSLGFLTQERVRQLKKAGVRRINNNLQTSREFYPQIVSTHTYDQRLEDLRILQEEAMEICSGGILGMGESREDRVKMAFELKSFKPRCLPVNMLNPRSGTPLENQPPLAPLEILKTVAVFRFVHPRVNIKLAGGREVNLTREHQEKALQGGANGIIMGGYLTTQGNPIEDDFAMMARAGYNVPKTEPMIPASSPI